MDDGQRNFSPSNTYTRSQTFTIWDKPSTCIGSTSFINVFNFVIRLSKIIKVWDEDHNFTLPPHLKKIAPIFTIVHVLISRVAPSPIKPQSLQILLVSNFLDFSHPYHMSMKCLALIKILLHLFSHFPYIYQTFAPHPNS